MDTGIRKATRNNSQNVLSGLLVCSDCGVNYRRITRASGEVVWRRADKVEKGKRSKCNNSYSLLESEVKSFICRELQLSSFDEAEIKAMIDYITISKNEMKIELKEIPFQRVLQP